MGQRQIHLLLDADVIHHQALVLALKLAVHPRDSLDQVVALHRLVDIDGIQERHIKAGEPHVHHNGDLEVGLGVLELPVQLLTVLLGAQHFPQRFVVILAAGHDHLHPLHGLDLFALLLGQLSPFLAGQHLIPRRAQRHHFLPESPGDVTATAHEHGLAFHRGAFLQPLLVVMHKVDGQCLNTIRVAQNGGHTATALLAFLNVVIAGAIFGTLVVVGLNLLELLVIQHHLGGTPLVNDTHGDLILHRFGHGVAVHHFTEHIQGGVDGGAGEAYIGGVGQ